MEQWQVTKITNLGLFKIARTDFDPILDLHDEIAITYDEAYANQIVREHNSHEALVEALKAAQPYVNYCALTSIKEMVRQVLSSAEG